MVLGLGDGAGGGEGGGVGGGGGWEYMMILFLTQQEFGQEFFLSRPQYGILGTGSSGSNRFVRALSSGGGSNAPHPALSVLLLDVNLNRRQARNRKGRGL